MNTITDFRRLGKRRLRRTPEEALQLHNERQRQHKWDEAASHPPRLGNWDWIKHPIPLGNHAIHHTDYQRAKNWTAQVPATTSSWASQDSHGRYSSQCTFTRYTYTQYVESWGIVVGGHLRATIDTGDGVRTTMFRAWRGWRWTVDVNGICLVDAHGKRDYHPTAKDLLDNPSTRQIAAIARANDERRREVAATARKELAGIRQAEREGARVCLADSVRAGNCPAGSTSWAKRHGIDVRRHYRPRYLIDLANGETDRVKLVVAVALKRHRREVRQGYCELSQHTV